MTEGKSEDEIYELPVMTWCCEIAPKFHWHVAEGEQPNAFNRMMQRLVFGFKWERMDNE